MDDKSKQAADNISSAFRRLYDENGNLRPEYEPKHEFSNISPFDKNDVVTVRRELIRELAVVFDKARVGHLIDSYHPGQIGWIITNLNEILKNNG